MGMMKGIIGTVVYTAIAAQLFVLEPEALHAQTTESAASEQAVLKRINEMLVQSPQLKDLGIVVSYKDGVATLDGKVDGQDTVDAVVLSVAKVSGVESIVNNIWYSK